MEIDESTKIKLHNDSEIPILGLGTWQITGKSAVNSVKWALNAGYRHIDTALIYGNEKEVGKGIRESSVPREEIFVTSKLWNDDQGEYDTVLKALNKSLENLGMDYVDLYLIHWPVSNKRLKSWKALERIYKEQEKVKAIGVSNFMISHLRQLLSKAEIVPMVNQVEFSPFLYLKDLKNLCDEHNIKIEAYSPLTHGKRLDNSTLVELGEKYEKRPAQILIRWGLQHGLIEIPKSSTKSHIEENYKVFDFKIDKVDMKKLNDLNENYRAGSWDPTSDRWK